MLFLTSRILDHDVDAEARLQLLERLQRSNWTPLIRSTRLNCFEKMLSDSNRVVEMERTIVKSTESGGQSSYISGDIFCFEDHIFFLLFGDSEDKFAGMRAGVVYEPETKEPLHKLDSFCQAITRCLAGDGAETNSHEEDGGTQLTRWRLERPPVNQGFIRFVSKQDVDLSYTVVRKENAIERVRASASLEDVYTRLFLRRAAEAYAEGYAVNLAAHGTSAPSELTVNKLVEVGLLRREVLVSCRQTNHMLFALPSSEALTIITLSEARCTECGEKIADEKIEDVVAPTHLTSALLEDGAWLVNRLHTILRQLGIPESEIAVEPPSGDGEARMMARVCGEPFLLVMRDGDLTPAFARRAMDIKIETEARHLVVVVTGAVHNEGRMSLQSFSKRLVRGGDDFELIIAEGTGAAAIELQYAFERVSQRVLAEQLCELDQSLGLKVADLINARFQLLRKPKDDEHNVHLPALTHATGMTSAGRSVPSNDLSPLDIDNERGHMLSPPFSVHRDG